MIVLDTCSSLMQRCFSYTNVEFRKCVAFCGSACRDIWIPGFWQGSDNDEN